MYACVCVCMYVCMCVCMYECMYECMCVCVCVCVCIGRVDYVQCIANAVDVETSIFPTQNTWVIDLGLISVMVQSKVSTNWDM